MESLIIICKIIQNAIAYYFSINIILKFLKNNKLVLKEDEKVSLFS